MKWGKQNGKQRYKCKACGLLFIRKHLGVSDKNKFVWFEDWVIGKQTIEQISLESGYPARTLIRYLHACLAKSPVFSVYPSERVNLLIDGTYFNNDLCLILYRDNTIKFTQLYRLTNGEWYEELKEDLENLLKLGVLIESITCDGHKALLKAVRKVCKQAVLQRCLVHIQRMCKVWLTTRPQSQAGIELRRIVGKLHLVRTTDERDSWIVSLVKWHQEHEAFINEKSFNADSSRYWYTHKLVRRSFMVIKKALPDMFHYLDNSRIPKSTNGLESFFGHLKGNLNIHRGLSHAHRKEFILWYLYLKNRKAGY